MIHPVSAYFCSSCGRCTSMQKNKKENIPMKWITREHVKVDRVACPWLITRFVDKDAEFLFVPESELLETARRESATSFDATRLAEVSMSQLVAYFLRLGSLGFGGPAALVAIMEDELVEQRHWLTRAEYLEGL